MLSSAATIQQVDRPVLGALCALIVGSLNSATWQDFEEVLKTCQAAKNDISRKEVEKAYHWVQARTQSQLWSNLQKMTSREVAEYKAMPSPFAYLGSRLRIVIVERSSCRCVAGTPRAGNALHG